MGGYPNFGNELGTNHKLKLAAGMLLRKAMQGCCLGAGKLYRDAIQNLRSRIVGDNLGRRSKITARQIKM